jgi:hypothetical protein
MLSSISIRLLEVQFDVTLAGTAGLVNDKNLPSSERHSLPIDTHLQLLTSSICILDASY